MPSTIEDKLNLLLATKTDIMQAIGNKGQIISSNTPFSAYAELINNIETSGGDAINLFQQVAEPESKDGIWVKTNTPFDNEMVVDNILTTSGEFTSIEPFPLVLDRRAYTVTVGTDIYIIGYNSSRYLYKYNTITNTYTRLVAFPSGFIVTDNYGIGGVYYNGSIYIMYFSTSGISGSKAYRYDIATNEVTELASPNKRGALGRRIGVCLINDNIYIAYYNNSKGCITKYSIENNTYEDVYQTTITSFNDAVAYGNEIYILSTSATYDVYKYNVVTGAFSTAGRIIYTPLLPAKISGTDIYFIANESSTKKLMKYNIITGQITILNATPSTYSNYCFGLVGINAYLFGGSSTGESWKYSTTLADTPNNTIVFEQAGDTYKIKMYEGLDLKYKFTTVWLKDDQGDIDVSTPIYVGNGTNWAQIAGNSL